MFINVLITLGWLENCIFLQRGYCSAAYLFWVAFAIDSGVDRWKGLGKSNDPM